MAITTTISRGYAARLIIIAVASLVFGLWGVYDYAVAIPRQAKDAHRLEIYKLVKDALEAGPEQEQIRSKSKTAFDAVIAQLRVILAREMGESAEGSDLSSDQALPQQISQLQEAIKASADGKWFQQLLVFVGALNTPRTAGDLKGVHLTAWEAANEGVNVLGTATAPGTFDRIMQWGFISCLPFVPYFLWSVARTARQVYRLSDDGVLELPGRTWPVDEIADIDMSRWMAKSIAHVVHRDGTRVKLDDYKHRHTHLIVGALAQRFYPDEWDAEAKQIKPGAPSEPPEAASFFDEGSSSAAEQPVEPTSPADAP